MRKHLIEAPQEVLVDGIIAGAKRGIASTPTRTKRLRCRVTWDGIFTSSQQMSNLMAMRRLAFQVSVDLKPFELHV